MGEEEDITAAFLDEDRRRLNAARRCIDLWRSFPTPVKVSNQFEIKFRLIFPLAAHALNLTDAALAQLPSHPLVAASIARLALEHAIAAQWVLLTEGGEVTLKNAMEHSWLTRVEKFARATDNPPELDDLIARPAIPGADRSFKMEDVFSRFDPSGLFYDTYRDLSQAVHPSFGTLQAHFDVSAQDHGTGTWPTRIDRNGAANTISSTATGLGLAALFALDALARVREGQGGLTDVEQIAEEAGMPHDLSFSDQHPERQPK